MCLIKRPRIFICYRRQDCGPQASHLNDAITSVFCKKYVFYDIRHINGPVKFDQVIKERIRKSNIFLILIGSRWLNEHRLENPEDLLRQEIKAAFEHNLHIMPVLVGNAQMPDKGNLPDDIRGVCEINAFPLSEERWDQDVKKIIAIIKDLFPLWKIRALFLRALLLLFISVLGYFIYSGTVTVEIQWKSANRYIESKRLLFDTSDAGIIYTNKANLVNYLKGLNEFKLGQLSESIGDLMDTVNIQQEQSPGFFNLDVTKLQNKLEEIKDSIRNAANGKK